MTGAVLLIFDVATHDRSLALTAAVAVAALLGALGMLPRILRMDRVQARLERAAR